MSALPPLEDLRARHVAPVTAFPLPARFDRSGAKRTLAFAVAAVVCGWLTVVIGG
jgi:hypothetical protein